MGTKDELDEGRELGISLTPAQVAVILTALVIVLVAIRMKRAR